MMRHPERNSGIQAGLRAYFKDLDTALSGLPPATREQLASEIRQHVDAAITERPPGSAAELRSLLDRVGRPEDIAAAARDEEPERQGRPARKGPPMLIAGVGVIMLAGLGTGLALAFSASNSPHKPADGGVAAGSHATTSHATSPTGSATSSAAPASSAGPTSSAGLTASPSSPASSPVSPIASRTNIAYAILSPATVAPTSAECTEQLSYGADGNVSPVTCRNGGVNTAAWHVLANGGLNGAAPTVLTLGRYASPGQVYQAMCHDISALHFTKPMEISVEELGQAYYGWKYGVSPVDDIESAGCPTS